MIVMVISAACRRLASVLARPLGYALYSCMIIIIGMISIAFIISFSIIVIIIISIINITSSMIVITIIIIIIRLS